MLEFGPSIQTTPALSCSHEHCTQSNLHQPTDIITFPSCIFRPKLSWSTTHVEPSCLVYKATEIACRPKRKERTFDCHVPRKALTTFKSSNGGQMGNCRVISLNIVSVTWVRIQCEGHHKCGIINPMHTYLDKLFNTRNFLIRGITE